MQPGLKRTRPPAKLRREDRDGRWTLKRGRRKRKPDGTPMMEIATPVYGYKSHVGVDRRHRFIRTWSVTDVARHDGRELAGLLDRSNTGSSVWADTAYRSAKNEKRIAKAGLVSKVHFRKPTGKPDASAAPEGQRCPLAGPVRRRACLRRPEAPDGLFIRTIGLARARAKIGLANIAGNMRRLLFLETATAAPA